MHDIWVIPLDFAPPEALPLSPDEWRRAEKMLSAPRRTFLASHYALRCILAAYLDLSPPQIEFQTDTYGKPSLRGASDLCFNLTHSDGLALCAITRAHRIGVDVELVRPIPDMDAIAQAHFAPTEVQQLAALPMEEKTAAFFALWTRKEAFVKAMGQGLSYPLKRFCVPLQFSTSDQRLIITDADSGKALAWTLFAFTPAPNYVAACVVEGQAEPPTLYSFRTLLK